MPLMTQGWPDQYREKPYQKASKQTNKTKKKGEGGERGRERERKLKKHYLAYKY